VSGRELIRILGKAGFTPARRRGSHVVLVKTDKGGKRAVVVPDHKEIDKGTLVEIIRQAGLKREEFFKLLK
jgi:predicted RNA binding protein YcfA (HicA-like mRNA interferase family)